MLPLKPLCCVAEISRIRRRDVRELEPNIGDQYQAIVPDWDETKVDHMRYETKSCGTACWIPSADDATEQLLAAVAEIHKNCLQGIPTNSKVTTLSIGHLQEYGLQIFFLLGANFEVDHFSARFLVFF